MLQNDGWRMNIWLIRLVVAGIVVGRKQSSFARRTAGGGCPRTSGEIYFLVGV